MIETASLLMNLLMHWYV